MSKIYLKLNKGIYHYSFEFFLLYYSNRYKFEITTDHSSGSCMHCFMANRPLDTIHNIHPGEYNW